MKKVIGIGNALTDILVSMPHDNLLNMHHLPKGSMQLIGYDFASALQQHVQPMHPNMACGGSAANTLCGLARMGVPAAFIGKTGTDAYGKKYEEDLILHGVQPHMIKVNDLSGYCTALISPDGERTMATYLGAAASLQAEEISPAMLQGYDILHIEGYLLQNHELIQHTIRLAKQCGMEVSLDMASYNVVEENLDFLQNIIKEYVDIVFANEEEAYAYTAMNPHKAVEAIAAQCRIAVVKEGKHGSWVQQGTCQLHADVFDAVRVDTTGAGDLYAAGFLAGYAQNMPLERCARMGSYVSSMIVEVVGPKFTDAKWQEMNAVMQSWQ